MKIKDIIEKLEDIVADYEWELEEGNINDFDDTISYDTVINTYKKCPHCEHKKRTWIREVLSDAYMKVKCDNCQNNYYIKFGK